MPAGCGALGSHNPYRPWWPPTSRRSAVFVSLFMMALSTFSMGCLPTYDQVGITASMLLVFVRLVQGVSVGGQLVGTYVRLLLHHTTRATLTYATSLSPGTLFRLKAALRCEWVALQAVGPVPMPLRSRLRCWPGETWPRLGDLLGWCDCWHRARTRRQRLTACHDDVVRGACACSACGGATSCACSRFSSQLTEWGWRLPFWCGMFVGIAGHFVKECVDEPPEFRTMLAQHNTVSNPTREALRTNWRGIVSITFTTCLWCVAVPAIGCPGAVYSCVTTCVCVTVRVCATGVRASTSSRCGCPRISWSSLIHRWNPRSASTPA